MSSADARLFDGLAFLAELMEWKTRMRWFAGAFRTSWSMKRSAWTVG
jgi:hypothetical protein